MNKKLLVTPFLIFSVLVFSGCGQNGVSSDKLSAPAPIDNLKTKTEKIEVMNFHATRRCVSCSTLGKYSEEVIYEFFQSELRDGIIEFQSINVDLPENKEIVKKYQAVGSSLFINDIYDGQDHVKQDVMVWRLLGNEQQFKDYLKNKINGLLNK